MQKIIAICGTICTNCPAFIATQKNDDNERKKVALMWSNEYNTELKPEDINCYGCLFDGEDIFSYCKICEIRKCGKEKNIKNCAYCDEYACEKLLNFFKMVPNCKTTLDEIMKTF